ncbi:hypothetical protein Bbelb_284000 [Branchiostoma belcheri]|nr:hypothetical protein Bbelb_284000 [Branchiostoma belcheri]
MRPAHCTTHTRRVPSTCRTSSKQRHAGGNTPPELVCRRRNMTAERKSFLTEVRAALDRYGVEDSGHRHLHKAVDMVLKTFPHLPFGRVREELKVVLKNRRYEKRTRKARKAPPTTASVRVRVTRPNGTLLASAEERGREGTAAMELLEKINNSDVEPREELDVVESLVGKKRMKGQIHYQAHNTNVREYKDDTRKIVKFISAPGQLVHCPFNPAHVVKCCKVENHFRKCCKVEDHFKKCSKCLTERRNSGQGRDQSQARTELAPCLRSRLLGFCLHEEGVDGMQKPIGQELQGLPVEHPVRNNRNYLGVFFRLREGHPTVVYVRAPLHLTGTECMQQSETLQAGIAELEAAPTEMDGQLHFKVGQTKGWPKALSADMMDS